MQSEYLLKIGPGFQAFDLFLLVIMTYAYNLVTASKLSQPR